MSLPARHRDRAPLFALLAILGPFLVYGVACSLDVSGIAPDPVPEPEGQPNAYLCECTCDAPVSDSPLTAAAQDDADERSTDGNVQLNANNVRLAVGRLAAFRFDGVSVPVGAEILSASIQFTATRSDAGAALFQVAGEAAADSAPLMGVNNDLSGRPPTTALAAWAPPDWVGGDAGPAQRTPELAALVQEIIDGGGWVSGNAMTFLVAAAAGERRVVAFDDDPAMAARLDVVYRELGVGVDVNLSVCMPPELNPNVAPDMGMAFDDAALAGDCTSRVQNNLDAIAGMCGYAAGCTCGSPAPARFVDLSCNAACTADPLAPDCSNFDPETGNKSATNAPGFDPVCLVASADPPVPVPDALAGGAFGRNSLCQADGVSFIDVPEQPLRTPATSAVITLSGDPCPGGACDVGVAYRADVDPFSYSGGFLGEGDTTISEVRISGASVPGGVSLIPAGLGTLDPETTFSTGRGRRVTNRVILSDIDKRESFIGTNASALAVNVDWVGKTCSLSGDLFGGMVTDDEPDMDEEPTESALTVTAALSGPILNQPPTADAGPDAAVECTSPGGATVVLDGSASSDPDDNIRFVRWRQGGRTGPDVGFATQTPVFQGLDVIEAYLLRVTDQHAQASEDTTVVLVQDTTDPVLTPPPDVTAECVGPEGTPVVLGVATAQDVCDPAVVLANDAPAVYPLGTTVVTWTATDASGNVDFATQLVTIEDTTDPVINLSLDPTSIWPPNHKLRKITASVEASDVCDPNPQVVLVSVESNEPDEDQTGDGNTTDDVQGAALGTDDRMFEVRSERKGNGSGRVYEATYKAVDGSGNETPTSQDVVVAK